MGTGINYENDEEKKQILEILLSLGYRFHGEDKLTTAESIMQSWGGYSAVGINYTKQRPEAIQLCGSSGNNLSWASQHAEVLALLKNFKNVDSSRIRVNNVGDYHAHVTKDDVTINRENLSHEKVLEIYGAFDNLNLTDDGNSAFCVTVNTSDERQTLFAIIYSMGWKYNNVSCEEAVKEFFPYGSIVLYSDRTIGGYFKHNTSTGEEFIFSEQLTEIYNKLSATGKTSTTIKNVGTYEAVIRKSFAEVGCQKITKEKVGEIVDAIKKFQK